jgi:hypothetical protein
MSYEKESTLIDEDALPARGHPCFVRQPFVTGC